MKITKVEPIRLAIPYDYCAKPTSPGQNNGRKATQEAVYVKVETDEGVTGWGEAFGLSACAVTHAAIGRAIAPLAIGKDPRNISEVMSGLHRSLKNMSRNGPVAFGLSGLDIALWDIAGKLVDKPISALLGGAVREQIPTYASLLRLDTPANVSEACAEAVGRGYKHIKLHERTVETVAAAREAIGADAPLMLDTNCQWDLQQALEMASRLRPYTLTWLEEPIFPPDDFEALAHLRREGGIRIAAGENLGNLMDIRHIVSAGAVDIVQPNVAKMGGITEIVKSLAIADATGIEVNPHSPLYGPALIATLHVLSTMKRDALCEFYYADLVANPIGDVATPRNGFLNVPTGPGLGIEIDEEMMEQFRVE